jgi:FKBP-type peptidyl-prolyl cis-trans isomerase 2
MGKKGFHMSNAGKRVAVHYTGTFDDGTVFDSSYKRGVPLEFVCMAGQMIPGFDKAVDNMERGETIKVHLEPSEAYGESDPDMIITKRISEIPGAEKVEKGAKVSMRTSGGPLTAIVTEKTDEIITLDFNNEMAGKALNFEITLVMVSD